MLARAYVHGAVVVALRELSYMLAPPLHSIKSAIALERVVTPLKFLEAFLELSTTRTTSMCRVKFCT
jgi:hypothetical protein